MFAFYPAAPIHSSPYHQRSYGYTSDYDVERYLRRIGHQRNAFVATLAREQQERACTARAEALRYHRHHLHPSFDFVVSPHHSSVDAFEHIFSGASDESHALFDLNDIIQEQRRVREQRKRVQEERDRVTLNQFLLAQKVALERQRRAKERHGRRTSIRFDSFDDLEAFVQEQGRVRDQQRRAVEEKRKVERESNHARHAAIVKTLTDLLIGEETRSGPALKKQPEQQASTSTFAEQFDAAPQAERASNTTPDASAGAALQRAAINVQAAFRARHARRIAMASLSSLASQFDHIRSSFVFPSVLDFASWSVSSDTVPKLAYSAVNTPLHVHEDALVKLLQALDAVESGGDALVRERRRELVRRVEHELSELDKRKAEVWKAMSTRDRKGKGREVPLDSGFIAAKVDSQQQSEPEVISPEKAGSDEQAPAAASTTNLPSDESSDTMNVDVKADLTSSGPGEDAAGPTTQNLSSDIILSDAGDAVTPATLCSPAVKDDFDNSVDKDDADAVDVSNLQSASQSTLLIDVGTIPEDSSHTQAATEQFTTSSQITADDLTILDQGAAGAVDGVPDAYAEVEVNKVSAVLPVESLPSQVNDVSDVAPDGATVSGAKQHGAPTFDVDASTSSESEVDSDSDVQEVSDVEGTDVEEGRSDSEFVVVH